MNLAVAQCQGCRHSVLNAFASIAGVSIRPQNQSRTTSLSLHHPRAIALRSFATSLRFNQQDDPLQSQSQTQPTPPTSDTSQPSSMRAAAITTIDPTIPWYLQVDTPTPPAPNIHHLSLQDIPPIPSDSPQILESILNHLSTQIGLDNLSLIDLRHLDPPAALGANLMMIIGTARSYKHLNTSADRFCRWLRSRYKLTPYADGLLGRNELKLKLRRKARKLKLAQSVGNTIIANEADDGITTGWICVNLGSVENAKIPAEETQIQDGLLQDQALTNMQQEELSAEEQEYENPDMVGDVDDGYIGFGSRSTAPRIVVQMFTQEKRLEMDLEGLWDHRQEKRENKAQRADANAREHLGHNHALLDTGSSPTPTTDFKPWVQ